MAWHVFRKVPILADVFPSRTVEAYDSSVGICPNGAFAVMYDGLGNRRYTISFTVTLDGAVPKETDLVLIPQSPISDPQTALGQRQQAVHPVFWKLVSRARHISFKVNAVESKEPDIGAYPQKPICGLCQSLRPTRISVPFAPRPVRQLMDLAIRIESEGSRNKRQKHGASHDGTNELPTLVFCQSTVDPPDNHTFCFGTQGLTLPAIRTLPQLSCETEAAARGQPPQRGRAFESPPKIC